MRQYYIDRNNSRSKIELVGLNEFAKTLRALRTFPALNRFLQYCVAYCMLKNMLAIFSALSLFTYCEILWQAVHESDVNDEYVSVLLSHHSRELT